MTFEPVAYEHYEPSTYVDTKSYYMVCQLVASHLQSLYQVMLIQSLSIWHLKL